MNRTRFNESQWRPALRKTGIGTEPGNGMHVLRHTAASAWLSAGVGVPAVAAWLGDTEVTVLSTYSHLMPDDTDRGRKAMDLFFTRSQNRPGSALNVP
jgi:integrase